MILSTRMTPPKALNLARPAPQRNLSFRHLLINSPLPSPSLPSILPRHGKKPPKINSKKIVRLLVWLTGVVTVYWCVTNFRQQESLLSRPEYLSSNGKAYEIVGEDELPEYALPVAVTDRRGRSKWTISIPSALDAPLPASDYSDICAQADDVAQHIAELKGRPRVAEAGYYDKDPDYVDIHEAKADGLLPRDSAALTTPPAEPVCAQSLTYVLDATNAGLGPTLMGLWLAYGLAQREKRAFFIDDTLFAYGNYTSYFTPPPKPSCQAPPRTQMVPCPHQARHLVVSAATTEWTFGAAFNQRFGRREQFDMLHVGYQALFTLGNEDDRTYVHERLNELKGEAGSIIGIHIRHGDRHPREYQYSESYIPLSQYMTAARHRPTKQKSRTLVLASDDPDVYDNAEVAGTIRAQERIHLATKKKLGNGGLGWEGGFFKNVFWSIGLPDGVREKKSAGSPKPTRQKISETVQAISNAVLAGELANDAGRDYRTQPTEEALYLRELLGRAYLMDVAILGQSEGVVCAVSTSTCRVLAVMMGWHRAIEQGQWMNIDGGEGREGDWRGLEWW